MATTASMLRADCLRVSLSDPRVIRREGWACPRPYQNGSGCWVLECELRRQAGAVHLPAWWAASGRRFVAHPLLSPPFAAQPACGATSLSLGPRALRWACRDVAGLSLGSINFLLVFLQVACAHISEQGRLVRQRFLESSQGLRAAGAVSRLTFVAGASGALPGGGASIACCGAQSP